MPANSHGQRVGGGARAVSVVGYLRVTEIMGCVSETLGKQFFFFFKKAIFKRFGKKKGCTWIETVGRKWP